MAAQDFLTEIYDKIWTLLEAHAPWTALVKPANRIKLDKVQPTKTNRQDADIVEAALWPAEIEDTAFRVTENFSYKNFNPLTQEWAEQITATYKLDLITTNLKIARTHAAILESMTALRKGGPLLGLSYVRRWGPVTMAERPDGLVQPVSDTLRIVSTLRIPVEMVFKGSSLIT